MNDDAKQEHLHNVLSRTGGYGPLYVRDDSTGELGEDAFRLAKPEEIGATYSALMAGSVKVRVGSIEIDAQLPADYPKDGPIGTFLLGQDATVTLDGEPYGERTGLKLQRVEIVIEHNKPLKVAIEGTPSV